MTTENTEAPPNYPALAGPLLTPERSAQIASVLSFTGGENEAGPEYGQFEPTQSNTPPIQGASSDTVAVVDQPIDYFKEREKGEKRKESWKSPDNSGTSNSISVPDTSVENATLPVLLRGANRKRYEIIIQNTGAKPITIGPTMQQAEQHGFTVLAGATLKLRSRSAWYAFAPAADPSTVDVLETWYDF